MAKKRKEKNTEALKRKEKNTEALKRIAIKPIGDGEQTVSHLQKHRRVVCTPMCSFLAHHTSV